MTSGATKSSDGNGRRGAVQYEVGRCSSSQSLGLRPRPRFAFLGTRTAIVREPISSGVAPKRKSSFDPPRRLTFERRNVQITRFIIVIVFGEHEKYEIN